MKIVELISNSITSAFKVNQVEEKMTELDILEMLEQSVKRPAEHAANHCFQFTSCWATSNEAIIFFRSFQKSPSNLPAAGRIQRTSASNSAAFRVASPTHRFYCLK